MSTIFCEETIYLSPTYVDDTVQAVELVQRKRCCQTGVSSGTVCGWCLILEGSVDAHHLPVHCGYTYAHAHTSISLVENTFIYLTMYLLQ